MFWRLDSLVQGRLSSRLGPILVYLALRSLADYDRGIEDLLLASQIGVFVPHIAQFRIYREIVGVAPEISGLIICALCHLGEAEVETFLSLVNHLRVRRTRAMEEVPLLRLFPAVFLPDALYLCPIYLP